jgi:hypothetical protein
LREQNLFRELRRVDSAQGPRIEIGGKIFLNFSPTIISASPIIPR